MFLDVKGAYDNVNWFILREKMMKLQIPQEVANTICKLYINSKHLDECINPLDSSTKLVLRSISDLGLQISAEKSKVIIFTRHNMKPMQQITIDCIEFPMDTNVKYLGITLDKKLTWKLHIEQIETKCNKGLNFLKSIMRSWWGAEPQTALIFYKGYIRSIIDYGCTLYGTANKTNLCKLDIIQNKSLRICLGAMKSTPVEPLRAEAIEPPLELRRSFLDEKMIIKSLNKNSPFISCIYKLNEYDLTKSKNQKQRNCGLSTMDIKKLIACVQENKCLWNMREKHYHNRDVCRQSWEKVASQLDTSSKQSL
ncbi:uncharacterized protein [Diabrotica undecimpunctata]|uniref:uncharacterized protein n=1 Tax=Diabrotica undecimpunctata TaxID=50387 RepID=UPI003B63FE23